MMAGCSFGFTKPKPQRIASILWHPMDRGLSVDIPRSRLQKFDIAVARRRRIEKSFACLIIDLIAG